jgi:hypothetical protein
MNKITVVLTVSTAVFAALWIQGTIHGSDRAVRNASQERGATMTNFTLVDLSPAQSNAIALASKVAEAPMISGQADALWGIDSFQTIVLVDPFASDVLSGDTLQARLNLGLSMRDIRLDNQSRTSLGVGVMWEDALDPDAKKNSDNPAFLYVLNVKLIVREAVLLFHHGDFRRDTVTIWEESARFSATRGNAQDMTLAEIEGIVDKFSKDLQFARARERSKIQSK